MTRTLIYGVTYCDTEERVEYCKLWGRLALHLNPDCDIVLIDACSPFDPAVFMPPSRIQHFRFPDNPGHLARGGKDGAGRSFCKGIELAYDGGYDYCVHWESDLFLARPVMPLIQMMARNGVKACATPTVQYQFLEWGICFFNTQYMIETNFIGRYDWENVKPTELPEFRIEEMLKRDLFMLPLRGFRNDHGTIGPNNLQMIWPYKPGDFITRVNMQTAMAFLASNNIQLP